MMLYYLFSCLAIIAVACSTAVLFRVSSQKKYDSNRVYYELTFPSEMGEAQIHDFIRSIGSNLKAESLFSGSPTVVFETWAQADVGITHRIRVPKPDATYLVGQLYTHLSGVDVIEIDDPEPVRFDLGATIHMRNRAEELPIASSVGYSTRLLGSMQDAVRQHDAVCIQWVIAHSDDQKQPASDRPVKTARAGVIDALFGESSASRDEVGSRRAKQMDQNYVAVGRVAASGEAAGRAEQLVRQVVRALTSEAGSSYFYSRRAQSSSITKDVAAASTPFALTAQLSVKELATIISWPMGDAYVPGLKRGSTRHMPAPESIPRQGRVLGKSTMPGQDRVIAMSYDPPPTGGDAPVSMGVFIAGQPGTGKTNLMEYIGRQDMELGAGLFLLERDGNLFHKLLNQVPPHRMQDVICIDFTNPSKPVGLNFLRLGKPEIIAGQLASLLDALYPASKSVFANQLVMQGIPVLANLERATIADLIPLAHPRNAAEKLWAKNAVAQMRDKAYRDFWDDWYKHADNQIAKDTQAFKNRMWELLTPEPIRYLVNQEVSSFDPLDIVNENKLLFVNLAGVSEQAASLIGTMIVTAMWRAAQVSTPEKPNFIYLDEFQQFSHLSHDFEDMLATGRKRLFSPVLATQYVERLDREMQNGVMANVRTKVILQSSATSASIYARDYASQHVRAESFMNLKIHDALARVATYEGVSEPVTLHTYDTPSGYMRGRDILEMSARLYGRNVADIERDDATRRIAKHEPPEDNGPLTGRRKY